MSVVVIGSFSGQTEIADPWRVVRIEKDVGRFDVAVYQGLVADGVQVLKAAGRTDRDRETERPRQHLQRIADTQTTLEAAARHVLVDEARLGTSDAVSERKTYNRLDI